MKLAKQVKTICENGEDRRFELQGKGLKVVQAELKKYKKQLLDIAKKIDDLALEIYEEDTAVGSATAIAREIGKEAIRLIEVGATGEEVPS